MRVPGDVVLVASWSLLAGFIVGLMISALAPEPFPVESQAYGRITAGVAVADVPSR